MSDSSMASTVKLALLDALGQGAHGPDEFGPSRVGDHQVHQEAVAAAGGLLDPPDGIPDGLRHGGEVPEHPHPDGAVPELVLLLVGVELEERHQGEDLLFGSKPVLGAEREEGEDLDPRFHGPVNHLPHGFHSRPVSFLPGERLLPGPAPVAVHDDGDVPGYRHAVQVRIGGGDGGIAHDSAAFEG
jgi:hypothetical protein